MACIIPSFNHLTISSSCSERSGFAGKLHPVVNQGKLARSLDTHRVKTNTSLSANFKGKNMVKTGVAEKMNFAAKDASSGTPETSDPAAIPGDHMAGAKVGELPPGVKSLVISEFHLESGICLRDVVLAYSTYGELNETGSNGVLVGHSLTSNSNVHEWWDEMLGQNSEDGEVTYCLDPAKDFIVCFNYCGSPYGSASPVTVDPSKENGGKYGADFPLFTLRDQARIQHAGLLQLGVTHLGMAIGGSMGSMLALEFACTFPRFVDDLVLIAGCGRHTDWAIGIGQVQRAAIQSDTAFQGGRYHDLEEKPESGLATARMMAMLSYRAPVSVDDKFNRTTIDEGENEMFAVESYLKYQGDKFILRFDANCYLHLTACLDTHDISRSRGGFRQVLEGVMQRALVVGIDSDMLYPIQLQQQMAEAFPRGTMHMINSPHGHDSFLIEIIALNDAIQRWRKGMQPSKAMEMAENFSLSLTEEERTQVLTEELAAAIQRSEGAEKEVLRLNLKLQEIERKLFVAKEKAASVGLSGSFEIEDSVEELRETDAKITRMMSQRQSPWGMVAHKHVEGQAQKKDLPIVFGKLEEGKGNRGGWA